MYKLPNKIIFNCKKLDEEEALHLKRLKQELDDIQLYEMEENKSEILEAGENYVVILTKDCYDEKYLKTGATLIVYDRDNGLALPYAIDLIVGSFEILTRNLIIKTWSLKNNISYRIVANKEIELSSISKEEVSELIKIKKEEHIRKWIGYTTDKDEEERILAYIDIIYKFYDYGMWIIRRLEDELIIGLISIDYLTTTKRARYEVGIFIRHNSLGLGYAKSAITLLFEYAKNIPLVDNLTAVVDYDNKAAIELFKSCGFMVRDKLGRSLILEKIL